MHPTEMPPISTFISASQLMMTAKAKEKKITDSEIK
jgi:hypothetical protein